MNVSKPTVTVGSRIELTCVVIGGPANPDIKWYNDSKLIGQSRRKKIETRDRYSRLIIRGVMAEDEGGYICQAIRYVGIKLIFLNGGLCNRSSVSR